MTRKPEERRTAAFQGRRQTEPLLHTIVEGEVGIRSQVKPSIPHDTHGAHPETSGATLAKDRAADQNTAATGIQSVVPYAVDRSQCRSKAASTNTKDRGEASTVTRNDAAPVHDASASQWLPLAKRSSDKQEAADLAIEDRSAKKSYQETAEAVSNNLEVLKDENMRKFDHISQATPSKSASDLLIEQPSKHWRRPMKPKPHQRRTDDNSLSVKLAVAKNAVILVRGASHMANNFETGCVEGRR